MVAVIDGFETGLEATDGPLPSPRTHDDVRGASGSRHSHGPPDASQAPTPRRRLLVAPRTSCGPPTDRFRGRGPATTSVMRRRSR